MQKTQLKTTTIGFVGLGRMGGNMAARFLAAGYPVYGEERHRGHADELLHQSLQWRDTPREVAESADIVFTSVPDDAVLDLVASGPDGILAVLAADKIWVDVSTVSPAVSRELAERVRARGATMLDAPVSGSVPRRELADPEPRHVHLRRVVGETSSSTDTGHPVCTGVP
jgi:3-hydroxyisobutyrate dehydrogenase-like beta-hydroxyacid dehydrogenase